MLGRWRVIEFNDIGELTSPVAIAGFEGWNDAGEAASGVVNHLGIAWQATPIGAIDPEEFYDFQVNRPVIEIEDGHTKRLIWPTTRLSLARAHAADGSVPPTGLSRDVILVHGIEPNMRWRAFSEELVRNLESPGRGAGHPARRAAGRRSAYPSGAGIGRLVEREAGHRVPAASAGWTTRARPGSSGCSSTPAPARACSRSRCGHRCRITWRSRPARRPPSRCCAASRTSWTRRCRWPICPRRPARGSEGWTSSPSRIPRSPTTSGRSRRPRTRWTCPRRAATPSPASSNATSGGTAVPGSPAAEIGGRRGG